MTDPDPTVPKALAARTLGPDVAALVICSLIWGTTWFAITLQFGHVPATWSIVYRFGLAAALLFAWCALSRQPLRLTRRQHGFALMQGLFTFAIDYALVYAAEARVLSGVVAVVFAALALANLIVFRIAAGRRSSGLAWAGALLGVAGVAILSGGELLKADLAPGAVLGIGLAFGAVVAGAVGNLFAARQDGEGTAVMPATAWAMAYGSGLLVIWALVTGQAPAFEFTVRYIGSLLYLSLFGSVVAFVLFYALARRRSYTFASYIAALTPPTAMLVSALFEHARWGWAAAVGLVLVLAGQVLLIRAPRT